MNDTRFNTLNLRNISCFAMIGVQPEEKQHVQEVIISLVIQYACIHKPIHYPDYDGLTKGIRAFVTARPFSLLEEMVNHLAHFIMEKYPFIYELELSIQKKAISMSQIDVSITTYRSRTQAAYNVY